MIQMRLAERDPSAQEVIGRAHKPGKIEPRSLRGRKRHDFSAVDVAPGTTIDSRGRVTVPR